jgi:surface antigen
MTLPETPLMKRALAALFLPLATSLAFVPAPTLAEPPPHAPAHGWRKKNDPNYVGYTGRAWPRDYGVVTGICRTDLILGAAGAAVGGVVGSQVGSGSGRTVATITGVALGAIIGAKVGRELDRADESCIGHTLELAPPGKPVRWTSPTTSVNYVLVPVRNVGTGCREFRLEANDKGKKSKGTKVACRSGDGVWRMRTAGTF